MNKKLFGLITGAAIFLVGIGAASAEVAPGYGTFTYKPGKDDFSDADRSYIFTVDEGADGGLGWKCMEGGMGVLYVFGRYLGGREGYVGVRYRVDDKPASEMEIWPLAQGHKSALMPGQMIADFTKSARVGSSVVFEVMDPLDASTYRHRFSLMGLQKGLAKLGCYKG